MDIIIQKLDGTEYKFSDYNISIEDFKIDSPSPRFNWETLEGRHGVIDLGTTYEERTLRGTFEFVAEDFLDFPQLRNDIFRLLDSRQSFYLIDTREPGKRWLVKANNYSPDQLIANRGKFNVDFTSPSTFAESIGTTLDQKTFDSQVWQTGQGLILDETMYTQTNTSFSIYNAADGVTINPRELPIVISFKGSSTNLQIKNITTGDVWKHTGTTIGADQLVLDGVKSLLNNISVFGNTNHKLISLVPGWNDFELSGITGSFTISFNFRFYTL